MSASDWILLTALGGVFGFAGQLIRMAMGLRKLHQASGGNKNVFSQAVDQGKLRLSLLYGVLAGGLAATGIATTTALPDLNDIPATFVTGLMVAGYSGADFLEGIVKNHFTAK